MNNDQPTTEHGVDDRTVLMGYLSGRDCACPRCGYNLRDLAGAHCPECGEELVLSVCPVQPRLAWFVTGLVGLSIGFGFHLILLGWLLFSYLTDDWPNLADPESVWVFCALGAFGVLLFGWLAGRRRLSVQHPLTRWSLALLSWLLGIGMSTVFLVLVN